VFRPADSTGVCRTLHQLGITSPYFLAVGTWEPRKNLELLIQVFRTMQANGELAGYRLVLAGGAGWRDKRLRALLRHEPDTLVGASPVVPLGFVSDEQLAQLYTGCHAFVFPSRYEGFGLPVLEARACGARVIATDIPEIREAAGDGALYIQPTFDGLQQGLRQSMTWPPAIPAAPPSSSTWRDAARVVAGCIDAK
jgi:glycosyltransferase involved in cell wall biosynthesis